MIIRGRSLIVVFDEEPSLAAYTGLKGDSL